MNAVDMTLVDGVYVSKHSVIAGEVSIGKGSNIWPYASIRGDVAAIKVGERVSVQDQVMLHCRHKIDLEIGNDVVIGHQACVHCKYVGEGALIGISSTILDHAVVGAGAIVAAGAVVKPGTEIPPGTMWAGVPAKQIRVLKDSEIEYIKDVSSRYLELAQNHVDGKFPKGFKPI